MSSILDMKAPEGNLWAELSNFLLPLKYLFTDDRLELFLKNVDLNYLANALFWIFLFYAIGFAGFNAIFQVFLKNTNITYYKRRPFARSVWNICFYTACVMFLYAFNEFMLLPQISKNQGRYSLFYSSENLIFYKSQQCEMFQVYSLLIITFYIHGALLDFKESDFLESALKFLYLLSLVAIDVYNYENYFVGLNLMLGVYNIVTECIILMALQTSSRSFFIYYIYLVIRIVSWAYVFINLLPFQYLVPTLFSKNFKIILNILIWTWYSLSIWNSPILQYFYHQIYHNTPQDCSGDGSVAKCILLRDSSEHRHFKMLRKAYLEVKYAHEKLNASSFGTSNPGEPSSSAKAFQTIKCIMTLKRKLKRIREGRGSEVEEDEDELPFYDSQEKL